MYNKVIMVGNLTRDLELKYAPSGTAIGSAGLATNRKFKSANGEQKEEVCFVDITFFGRTAEIANQYLKRGSKVLVEGRLKFDTWTDQNGGKRSKHSITVDNMQMLDSKGSNPSENSGYNQNQGGYNTPTPDNNYKSPTQAQNTPVTPPSTSASNQPGSSIPEIDIDDDEIPF